MKTYTHCEGIFTKTIKALKLESNRRFSDRYNKRHERDAVRLISALVAFIALTAHATMV